jgi:DNA-binding response OmpR family regulator
MKTRPAGPILVVEADRGRGSVIANQLLTDGFAVDVARTVEHARILARARAPELALLGDLEPPRGALALLEEIRSAPHGQTPWDRALPAIVVGVNGQELEMLRAFEAGADDFILRSAGYLELRARVRAILRRVAGPDEPSRELVIGGLQIDSYAHTASLCGQPLELRRMEFELLVCLAREPTRVFTRKELLRSVWGYGSGGSTRTVDSHASRLRQKLAADQTQRWVVNVWGVGYRLI